MKLTVSTLCCPTWTLPQIIENAAANSISGIDFRGLGSEIDITRLADFTSGFDQTLALLRENHLQMPCLNMSVTLVTPAPERWAAMLEETQRHAQLASRAGTRFLRIFGGRVPKDLTRDEAQMLAQRHLRQLIKICTPFGCMPILETHDDWATSNRVLELLDGFDPADAGVLWDLEHPARQGESPAITAAALSQFIRHVHVKDSIIVNEKYRPALPGDGTLPLAECAAALEAIQYRGWYCLEVEKRWDDTAPDPERSLPAFAKYMKEVWQRQR